MHKVEKEKLITGTAFRIYLLLLNSKRPMGVREMQRAVGLKSASTVKYHLDRLTAKGLVRQLPDGKYIAIKSDNPALTGYLVIMNTPIPYLIPAGLAFSVFILVYSLLRGPPDPVVIISSLVFGAYAVFEGLRTRRMIKYLSGK